MNDEARKELLAKFLKEPINSVTREAILTQRFMYDISLAAAGREYALQVFTQAVDRDGVDVVLSDHDIVRTVQLSRRLFGLGPRH